MTMDGAERWATDGEYAAAAVIFIVIVRLWRPLSTTERVMTVARDGVAAFTQVCAARVEGPLSTEQLRAAVAWASRRHPLLSSRVLAVDAAEFAGHKRFEQGAPAPELTEHDADEPLDALLEAALHAPPPGPADPVWTVALLRTAAPDTNWLVCSFSRAAADGPSVKRVIHDVLARCAGHTTGDEDEDEPLALVPSVEAQLPPPSLGQRLKAWAFLRWPRVLSRPPAVLPPGAPAAPHRARRTRVELRRLGEEDTAGLLRHCRLEGTTLHAAVSAALMLEAAAVLRPAGGAVSVRHHTPVSVRQHTTPELADEHVLHAISSVTVEQRVSADADLWATARATKAVLIKRLGANAQLELLQLSDAALPGADEEAALFAFADDAARQGRFCTTAVHNGGRFPFKTELGELRVSEYYNASSQHVVGALFWLGLQTLENRLHLTFCSASPLVPDEVAARVARAMVTRLTREGATEVESAFG